MSRRTEKVTSCDVRRVDATSESQNGSAVLRVLPFASSVLLIDEIRVNWPVSCPSHARTHENLRAVMQMINKETMLLKDQLYLRVSIANSLNCSAIYKNQIEASHSLGRVTTLPSGEKSSTQCWTKQYDDEPNTSTPTSSMRFRLQPANAMPGFPTPPAPLARLYHRQHHPALDNSTRHSQNSRFTT